MKGNNPRTQTLKFTKRQSSSSHQVNNYDEAQNGKPIAAKTIMSQWVFQKNRIIPMFALREEERRILRTRPAKAKLSDRLCKESFVALVVWRPISTSPVGWMEIWVQHHSTATYPLQILVLIYVEIPTLYSLCLRIIAVFRAPKSQERYMTRKVQTQRYRFPCRF